MEEKKDLPKRKSDLYTNIEDFELFELTYCLAYEMHIRTTNEERIKNKFDSFASILEYTTDDIIIENYDGIRNKVLSDIIDEIFPSLHQDTWNLVKKENNLNENSYDDFKKIKSLYNIKKKSLKYIIDNYINNLKKEYVVYCVDEDNELEREKLKILIGNSLNNSKKIYPRFKRPRISSLETRTYDLMNINLGLPLKEIVDYIKKLKFKYKINIDSNHDSIKTPTELIRMCVHSYNLPKGLPQNKDKGFSIQQKWADWFFIYDYFKLSKNINPYIPDNAIYKEIDDELKKYHDKDGILKYWKSLDVYRQNILPPMIELIDNKNYMNLINGVN